MSILLCKKRKRKKRTVPKSNRGRFFAFSRHTGVVKRKKGTSTEVPFLSVFCSFFIFFGGHSLRDPLIAHQKAIVNLSHRLYKSLVLHTSIPSFSNLARSSFFMDARVLLTHDRLHPILRAISSRGMTKKYRLIKAYSFLSDTESRYAEMILPISLASNSFWRSFPICRSVAPAM